MELVLVRHAAVEIDPAVLPALWQLSDEGRAAARALAREPVWRQVTRIFSSPESKAHETAQIIAGANGITVTVVEELREVERPANQWFDASFPGSYPAAVAAYLSARNDSLHGWEAPAIAQSRIRGCIDGLLAWEPGPVAVCGHGLTLSLYVASVTGIAPQEIWPSITLPDFAVLDTERRAIVRPFGTWRARAGQA
jgi:broad specificity phosphatase PhoE